MTQSVDVEPEMANVERETRAMLAIAKALQGLTDEQRARVLAWMLARYGAALGGPLVGTILENIIQDGS